MQAIILAGGLGTRLSEETSLKPKPMVEIGGRPILWHIMKIYSYHGINDFIICCGYKGYLIKEYFSNYFIHMSDIKVDLSKNNVEIIKKRSESWKITMIDTGEKTMTGGRLLRVKEYLDNEDFCFTYGDGLSDININKLVEFHKKHGKIATVTAVHPPGRFGAIKLEKNKVLEFKEKPKGDGSRVNGGFFVLNKKVFDFIKGDDEIWEQNPLISLAKSKELIAYKHNGFWRPMDTLRDKESLEKMWLSKQAPWKVWE